MYAWQLSPLYLIYRVRAKILFLHRYVSLEKENITYRETVPRERFSNCNLAFSLSLSLSLRDSHTVVIPGDIETIHTIVAQHTHLPSICRLFTRLQHCMVSQSNIFTRKLRIFYTEVCGFLLNLKKTVKV